MEFSASRLAGTGGYGSAYGHGRRLAFWPTTVNPPARGCWVITETLGASTIRSLLPVP